MTLATFSALWAILIATTVAHYIQTTPTPVNPCTAETISQGQYYHPYPGDRSKYIQCNEWGQAYIGKCAENQIWDEKSKTCVMPEVRAGIFKGSNKAQNINQPNLGPAKYDTHLDQQSDKGSHPQSDYRQSASQQPVGSAQTPLQPDYKGPVDKYDHSRLPVQSTHNKSQPPYYKQPPYQNAPDGETEDKNSRSESQSKTHRPMYNQQPSKNYDHPQPPKSSNYIRPPTTSNYDMKGDNSQQKYKGKRQTTTSPQLNPMNPCDDPKVQFIQHPINPQKYYRCVNGQLFQELCASDQIWTMSVEQCIPIKNLYSCTPSQVGNCWAYPGDTSKYIECGSEGESQVKECDAGTSWEQQSKKCLPEVISSTTMSPQKPADPCLASTSFYHPYPNDDRKFIQCDQTGGMFIRFCGVDKVWDDDLKTCVGRLNLLTYNLTAGEAKAILPAGVDAEYCAPGAVWDAETRSCVVIPTDRAKGKCPAGFVFNPDYLRCMQIIDYEGLTGMSTTQK